MKTIKLKDFEIGSNTLTILAGPCVAESQAILDETASGLKEITERLGINFVFKSSFDKANRSSINSYRGPGIVKGLEMLQTIKDKYDLPIVTDIHTPDQAQIAAEVADIIQIPAFLCRQTDLLVAAAKTDKIVNIKKGQFLAPEQMEQLAKKVEDSGNSKILLTDRGTSFGYNNLLYLMQRTAYNYRVHKAHVRAATEGLYRLWQKPQWQAEQMYYSLKCIQILIKGFVTDRI